MRTLKEYSTWLREVQPLLDKMDEKGLSKLVGEFPLHPVQDNLLLMVDLSIQQTINLLRNVKIDRIIPTPHGRYKEGYEFRDSHDWRRDHCIFGYLWPDRQRYEFWETPYQSIKIDDLEIEYPSVRLWNINNKGPVGNLSIQTSLSFHPTIDTRNVDLRRFVETSMLGLLDYITENRIEAFYGCQKTTMGVINTSL